MNRVVLTVFGCALLLNVILGLLFSAYIPFRVILNSVMLIINGAVVAYLFSADIKDGFRIGLSSLIGTATVIEFIAGFFSPERVEDNPVVIGFVIVMLLEVIGIVIAKTASRNI